MTLKERDVIRRTPGLTTQRLEAWITRGWVAPARDETGHAFEDIDIARIDLIRQLRDDLAIDREALPVLLSLLDQVYSLRHDLRCVMRALDEQPIEVREKIVARFRTHHGDDAG